MASSHWFLGVVKEIHQDAGNVTIALATLAAGFEQCPACPRSPIDFSLIVPPIGAPGKHETS